MFGVRLITRIGSVALRQFRPLPARLSGPAPPRARLSVEPLTDRLVPSANLISLSGLSPSQGLTNADTTQVRFVEIPASGPWQDHVGSLTPLVSPQQLFAALGGTGTSTLSQLGAPTVTSGTVEYGGETISTLVLQFGSAITVNLAYGTTGAGTGSSSAFVGALVNVDFDGTARRFLIDHQDGEQNGPMMLPPILDAFHTDVRAGDSDTNSNAAAAGAFRQGSDGLTPANMSAAVPSSALTAFIAGWLNGRQIADGLAVPTADGTWVNTVEVALNAGNPADVLLAVDTVLPDARADLIRLKDADLAVVPAYVIGDTPGAPARADEQPDSGLMARVVGLDELPSGVPPAPVSVEQLLGVLGAPGSHDAQPGEVEVRDAGFALREWLEEILNQSGSGAVVVALVLEGALVTYVYQRSRRIGYAIRASQIRFGRPGEKT